jgi:hypothetical protein
MSGGTISNNTASYGGGGGVYVGDSGAFTKTGGGVIYGSDADNSLQNTVQDTANFRGHAVYYRHSSGNTTSLYRNTTLDTGDDISTTDTTSGWGGRY